MKRPGGQKKNTTTSFKKEMNRLFEIQISFFTQKTYINGREMCDNLDSVNNFQTKSRTKRERRHQREKATPGKGLPVIFNPLSLESRILLRVIEKYSL